MYRALRFIRKLSFWLNTNGCRDILIWRFCNVGSGEKLIFGWFLRQKPRAKLSACTFMSFWKNRWSAVSGRSGTTNCWLPSTCWRSRDGCNGGIIYRIIKKITQRRQAFAGFLRYATGDMPTCSLKYLPRNDWFWKFISLAISFTLFVVLRSSERNSSVT